MAKELPILMRPEDVQRLMRLLRKRTRGAAGIEVTDSDEACVISLRAGGGRGGQPAAIPFYAAITASAPHPVNADRWLYGWRELRKVDPVDGVSQGWIPLTGGREGTVSDHPALNLAEGNYIVANELYLASGVLKSNLPGTFAQPKIPNGSVVIMSPVQNPDGSVEYWFERGGVPDGEC